MEIWKMIEKNNEISSEVEKNSTLRVISPLWQGIKSPHVHFNMLFDTPKFSMDSGLLIDFSK
jgi:hypothetical protein